MRSKEFSLSTINRVVVGSNPTRHRAVAQSGRALKPKVQTLTAPVDAEWKTSNSPGS